MDKNYLNSLAGSPYVDEGLWDRVKSRGAAGIQRYKGVAGMGWKPLDEAKLDSLWNSFKKKTTNLVQDFNTNVLPNIYSHRKQDVVTHQADILNLQKLGKLLVPRQFGDSQLQNILVPRSQHDPSKLKEENGSDFGQTLREAGIGKFFRPYSLTQALMSNDTGKVITAYKSQLKKLYNDFINDVKTILKLPDTTFVGRNIVTQKPEWAPTLNQWETVVGVEKSVPAPKAPETPATPTPTTSTEPPKPAAPAGTAPEPKAGSPSSTVPSSVAPPPQAGIPGVASTTDSKLPDELNADVIAKTAIHIIKRVKSDYERSKNYFEKDLPSSWSDDSPIKIPPTSLEEEKNSDEEKGVLHKFHAEYDKSREFSHNFGAFKHGDKTYEVFWNTSGQLKHGTKNEITLKIYDEGKVDPIGKKQPIKVTQVTLFSFYDHDIDPRSGKILTIPEMFEKAHPNLKNAFSKEDMKKINAVQEEFQRAVFALTDRKAMEYKPIKTSAMKDAEKALIQLGYKDKEAIIQIKNAAEKLGSEASSADLTNFVVSGGKLAMPSTTSTTTPAAPAAPVSPPVPTPTASPAPPPTPTPTPTPVTPTEPPTPPQGSTQEQQLAKVNTGLESIGIDKLDNVKQLAKLFSLKGSWNTKMKTLAQNQDRPELLDNVLGKGFDAKHDKIWTKLVAKAKTQSAAENPPTTEGLISKRWINPFVPINFVH